MSLLLRRSYPSAKKMTLFVSKHEKPVICGRNMSDGENQKNDSEFTNSTLLMENGFNVQELPVIVRKLKDIEEIEQRRSKNTTKFSEDPVNYQLIQTEFNQCMDLRDVFSLLSKCTKITPNIALGAMERIYDLEKHPTAISLANKDINAALAKGAILDKLLKVIITTEDTQTIQVILNTESSFMEPYKFKFCDELMLRVIDNNITIDQLCEFARFLMDNKNEIKYVETIDKLWVGFIEKERDITENHISILYSILPALKASKQTILSLAEQKLSELWFKINLQDMPDILSNLIHEKYVSEQSLTAISRWLYLNIHALNDDSLLDMITKFNRLTYIDSNIEKAVEKYMSLKSSKIKSQILVVGILNYCLQLKVRNENILNSCCEYFLLNYESLPLSFLKSCIYPFGYLYFDPLKSKDFWLLVENLLLNNYEKLKIGDLSTIVLSQIYLGVYPLKLVHKIFSSECLAITKSQDVVKRLNLIDTSLSLECKQYSGPLLPKDQCSISVSQDIRIRNIIEKIKDNFISVAGGEDKVSLSVLIPNLCSDETYLIDVMLHPSGLGSKTFNWKNKSDKNEIIAIIINLPDHYCSDNEQLIGSQMMKRKHLKLLGFKVVSVRYSIINQLYICRNEEKLNMYLIDCINNAEVCI